MSQEDKVEKVAESLFKTYSGVQTDAEVFMQAKQIIEFVHGYDRPNIRTLHDNFTEVVIYQLYCFDTAAGSGMMPFAHNDLKTIKEEGIKKYQNDHLFHAKVQSMVAQLLEATTNKGASHELG